SWVSSISPCKFLCFAHSIDILISALTGNEAPQDALLSTESIEVRPLVPKGFLSVRQTGILFIQQVL
ncbi:hypothetical protein, partial [Campylobacter coli]|uniref:hypothetical protein n=1 Tax=Campylobacter coli TaxID=195 RepID=UPI0020C1A630